MGFVKEGNRISAAKGHELHLIECFAKHGYIIEIHDDVLDANIQYPVDAAALKHHDEDEQRQVTDADELDLEYFDYEAEARRMGLLN